MKVSYAAYLLVTSTFLSGCTASKPEGGHEMTHAEKSPVVIELQSINGLTRACFRVSGALHHTIDKENKELGFRFWDAEDLTNARLGYPTDKRFGENVAVVTIFSNEGEKQGALAYWESKTTPVDIGHYQYFAPQTAALQLQTILIAKSGLIAIRLYPANAKAPLETLSVEAKALAEFIDHIITPCKDA
jgi:hypothetical protein